MPGLHFPNFRNYTCNKIEGYTPDRGPMITEENSYGIVGWREFRSNRDEILSAYDTAKRRNRSRPVQTSHGNAGEAAVRKWLLSFLPARFGVTAGFVIPDIVQQSDYKIYAYDVIIYEKDKSPVLWIDGDEDTSRQGRKRAIPARYVRSIIEVKSTLTKSNIVDSLYKLRQLNAVAPYLDVKFTSSILFFEYRNKDNFPSEALGAFLPDQLVVGYCGAAILRCDLNEDMVGLVSLARLDEEGGQSASSSTHLPLARDIDKIGIRQLADGTVEVNEQGAGVEMYAWHGAWRVMKTYGPQFWSGNVGINLSWSYGNFSKFATGLLGRIEGDKLQKEGVCYGQIFDRL